VADPSAGAVVPDKTRPITEADVDAALEFWRKEDPEWNSSADMFWQRKKARGRLQKERAKAVEAAYAAKKRAEEAALKVARSKSRSRG